jgi:hypothetical protein
MVHVSGQKTLSVVIACIWLLSQMMQNFGDHGTGASSTGIDGDMSRFNVKRFSDFHQLTDSGLRVSGLQKRSISVFACAFKLLRQGSFQVNNRAALMQIMAACGRQNSASACRHDNATALS